MRQPCPQTLQSHNNFVTSWMGWGNPIRDILKIRSVMLIL